MSTVTTTDIQHAVEDAVRERRGADLQPRADDAGGVAVVDHEIASRVPGRASASRAARNPRIA